MGRAKKVESKYWIAFGNICPGRVPEGNRHASLADFSEVIFVFQQELSVIRQKLRLVVIEVIILQVRVRY